MNDGKYYSQVRREMLDFIDVSDGNLKRILDVGAGDGGFICTVKESLACDEIWAVEPTYISKKIVADRVLNMSVEDALAILPDAYFDLIIFNDVLEHLVDPWNVLVSVKRSLTHDGQIVISVPNILFIHTFKNILLGDFKYESYGVLDRTHLRFFTKKSLVDMIDECGYRVETIKGINGFYTWKYQVLNILTFGFFRDWFHQQWACRVRI